MTDAQSPAYRYFFDTEFAEDGKVIDLISIGMVAEDGREFYAVSTEFDVDRCNQWVKDNVLPLLPPRDDPAWMSRDAMRTALLAFVGACKPEFWAYYADYDWVALCQLFGTMMDLPEGWPMYCRDIKQLCDDLGNPKLPEQVGAEHNALADARWNVEAHAFLTDANAPPPIRCATWCSQHPDCRHDWSAFEATLTGGSTPNPTEATDENAKTSKPDEAS